MKNIYQQLSVYHKKINQNQELLKYLNNEILNNSI
jgi:hypothetical protein